jgi:hypothetical protein
MGGDVFKHARPVVGAAVLSLVCCGGSFAATHDDACLLLTPAQVSTAVGGPVQAGTSMGVRMCEWAQLDASGSKAKHVLLTVFGQMGKLTPVDRFNNSKNAVSGIAKTSVSGVGDDAMLIATGGMALNVRSGSSAFQIRVSGAGLSQDQIKQMEIALAKDVIPKL